MSTQRFDENKKQPRGRGAKRAPKAGKSRRKHRGIGNANVAKPVDVSVLDGIRVEKTYWLPESEFG